MIAGFSNGSVGYLSDKQAYVEGGYEPYFANFFYGLPEFEPNLEDAILNGATTAEEFCAIERLWPRQSCRFRHD